MQIKCVCSNVSEVFAPEFPNRIGIFIFQHLWPGRYGSWVKFGKYVLTSVSCIAPPQPGAKFYIL